MSQIDERLHSLGVTLPKAAAPVANYVAAVQSGSLLFVSGQIPLGLDGKLAPEHTGKLGPESSPAAARAAAQACALNVLAQAKAALGDLDRIVRVVRLGGFFSVDGRFDALAPAMNGASDLMANGFGDKGRHARTTIGVAFLPMNALCEVEAIFEIAP